MNQRLDNTPSFRSLLQRRTVALMNVTTAPNSLKANPTSYLGEDTEAQARTHHEVHPAPKARGNHIDLALVRVPGQVDGQGQVDEREEEQVQDHEEPEDVPLLVQARLGPAGGGTRDKHGDGLQDQETSGSGAPDDVAPETVDLCVCVFRVGREGE